MKKKVFIYQNGREREIENKLDMTGFENAIEAIKEIRKYKSENKISLGAEIEEYSLVTKVDIEKYGEFIKKAIKVKKLI
jgi:valyl-tRNA synthetase